MKRILIATAIGASVLTAGCAGGTTGEAKSDQTTGGSTPTSSSSKLESLKACDLLTESEAKSLGYTYPGDDDSDASAGDGCDWSMTGKGGTIVAIRPHKGVKDLNLQGNKISNIKIGQYDVRKIEGTNGNATSCSLVISVTDSSSVQIVSNHGLSDNTDELCERASKVADIIVPKLS